MKTINELLCYVMHDFVSKHSDEIKESYACLGFRDKNDMLQQIKDEFEVAYWALTELLDWGMSKCYLREMFIEEETDEYTVFKFSSKDGMRYLICKYPLHDPIEIYEVKKVTKMVEVTMWE